MKSSHDQALQITRYIFIIKMNNNNNKLIIITVTKCRRQCQTSDKINLLGSRSPSAAVTVKCNKRNWLSDVVNNFTNCIAKTVGRRARAEARALATLLR